MTNYNGHKTTKSTKFPKPKQKHEHAQIQIQFVKQEKQEQEQNMCKIRIKQDFIAIMKQEENKVVTKKRTQNWLIESELEVN